MLASSGLSNDEIVARHGDRVLLGRVGQPEETAALVEFLASQQNSYMTGTEFVIDGGMTANYGT
jgi:NAD(P)-dependent dehydrogenase (short-subunit alcohol dehydrogenase family)